MKITDIKPNDKNPMTISGDKLKKLKKSITAFSRMMALRPIIVDADGVILGGNMRYRAIKDLGYKEIPDEWVVKAEDLTDEEKQRFIIEDNVGFGEWNWEVLETDWDMEKLADWGLDVPVDDDALKLDADDTQEDEFDEDKEEIPPVCQRGDIWQLGEHRLMCGDSTDAGAVALLMNGEKAEMLMTDPPYNIDYTGATKEHMKIDNDKMADDEFVSFLVRSFANANDNMAAGASAYVWYAPTKGLQALTAYQKVWKLRQELIWVKNTFSFGRQDYQWQHEPCLYGWKDGTHYFTPLRNLGTVIEEDKLDIKKMTKDDLIEEVKRLREQTHSTVIRENKPLRNGEHPTMKPVRLISRLIANSTINGNLIIDLFGGSGTTLIAAEQLHRRCYMMEFDPHYCDVIIARWEKLTGRTAIKCPN